MKTKIIILFAVIISYSCKETSQDLISFNVSQPEGKNKLNEFPSRLFGIYKNYDTQEEITICKNIIFSVKFIKVTIPKSLKDSLKNEKLFNTYFKITKLESIKNDSLLVTYKIIDTIFELKKDVLKKFKGHYFLNYQQNSMKWNVKKLSYNKNVININAIETINEIKTMEDIMGLNSNDTLHSLIVKPTKRQFKEFINKSGFHNGSSYLKIK
jgi:hypothetical protein